MAELYETYARVRRSIVAITQNFAETPAGQGPPVFPHIIGTGYLVSPDGLVATNRHVVEAVQRLRHPSGKWGASAMLLFDHPPYGQAELSLEVIGALVPRMEFTGYYYGDPRGPDIALLHVKGKDLPFLEYDSSFVPLEGHRVATAGYPMGTAALTAPGWMNQICPTLTEGVISAVHPFACPTPHGFSINVMTRGGASGSPVFLPASGTVVGTLFAGLNDLEPHPRVGAYVVPAGHSHIVPAHYSLRVLHEVQANPPYKVPEDAKSIEDYLREWDGKSVFDRDRWTQLPDSGKPSDKADG